MKELLLDDNDIRVKIGIVIAILRYQIPPSTFSTGDQGSTPLWQTDEDKYNDPIVLEYVQFWKKSHGPHRIKVFVFSTKEILP